MLQNMRHARSVGRVSLESNSKNIVLIITGDMHVVCISLVVFQPDCRQVKLGDMLLFMQSESVELLADVGKVVQVCNG